MRDQERPNVLVSKGKSGGRGRRTTFKRKASKSEVKTEQKSSSNKENEQILKAVFKSCRLEQQFKFSFSKIEGRSKGSRSTAASSEFTMVD